MSDLEDLKDLGLAMHSESLRNSVRALEEVFLMSCLVLIQQGRREPSMAKTSGMI